MRYIIKIIKKISFGLIVLYSFNIIMNSLNMFIPINIITASIVSTLGFPGMFLLVGILLIK